MSDKTTFRPHGSSTVLGERIAGSALVEARTPVRSKNQSCPLEGCTGIVRRRDRQNHAFAL